MGRSQGGLISSIGRALSCLLLANTLTTSIAETMHELVTTYQAGWIQDGVMFDVQAVRVDSTSTDASGGAAIGTTGPDGITIYGLNILTPLTETFCVELYTKSGSFDSAAFDEDAWTFLGSFSIVGQGPTSPTPIPFGSFDPVTIGVDEVQAFYVTTQDEKLRYTALDDGTVTGDVYSESEPHYISAASVTERTSGISEEDGDKKRDSGRTTKGRGKSNEPRNGQRLKKREGRDIDGRGNDRALQATTTSGNGDGLTVQILTGVAKDYPFKASWPNRVFNGAIQYQLGQDDSLGFLTDAQMAEAWSVKRGQVKCDVDAIPPESYPSVAPSDPRVPTATPSKSPTAKPSTSPSVSPTTASPISSSPTTLESTVRKIATTLHGGMKQSGCMFDIRVPSVEEGGPPEGLTVLSVEMSTFLTDDTCVEVYTKTDTYEGYENDVTQNADGSWSSPLHLGASTVMGNGELEPTHVPIGHLDPVFVPAGSRQAFYVTLTQPEMRYTEPKYGEGSGELFSGSPLGHIELMVGSAVAYPFEQTWKDRIFNGAVVYALGEVDDGKYNSMTAADRNRTCPVFTESPTTGPTAGPTASPVVPVVDVVETTTVATEAAATNATEDAGSSSDIVDIVQTDEPTKRPTSSPSFGLTSTIDTPSEEPPTARHADTCPGTIVTATSTSKDVAVTYEYTVITEAGKDVKDVITEVEKVLHQALMADMCSAPGNSGNAPGDAASPEKRKTRSLQEATYKGFNSNPTDTASDEGCSSSVTLAEGQQCYVIQGGATAVVGGNDDDDAVKGEVGSFVNGVFSDPMMKELDGVQAVYVASDGGSTDTDGTVEDDNGSITDSTDGTDETDGTEDGDRNIDGVQDGDNPPAEDSEPSKALSTTGIIIIAVLASTFVLVALFLVAMRARKKRRTVKRADSKELFHEFPDEAERGDYGVNASSSAGYHESFAPLGRETPPPPPGRPSSSMSYRSSEGVEQAVILNEDDMSLFSKNSRFASSAMIASQQGMPRSSGSVGSRGSRGSNSSKKSVEFVKAGQSFSSRASNQPEDTVDL